MKWRKQMTAMWDDEKVARLVKSGGVEGLAAFGLYCRILDIVACQMDSKSGHCAVTYDITRWSLLLSLRGSHVRHWLEKLAVTTLVTTEWNGSECRVTIPKLLKYRDEYSKKSGQNPHKEQNRTDTEQSTDKKPYREAPEITARNAVEEVKAAAKATANCRGSRLDIHSLPPSWESWAVEKLEWTPVHCGEVFDIFHDFWCSKSGRDATKVEWFLTWKNWCRNQRSLPTVLKKVPKREGIADSMIREVRERIARGERAL